MTRRRTGIGLLAAAAALAAPAAQAADLPSSARVDRDPVTQAVTFVGTAPGATAGRAAGVSDETPAVTAARRYLQERATTFGLEGSALRHVRTTAGPDGSTAVRLQQTVDGVPVMGAEFAVDLDAANRVRSVLGEASPAGVATTVPAVSAADARRAAPAQAAAPGSTADTPVLSIWDPQVMGAGTGAARLVWATSVDDGAGVSKLVVADARDGATVTVLELGNQAKERVVCDFEEDRERAEEECTADDAARTETGPASGIAAVDLMFDRLGAAYDYYASEFGRDSVDDKGLPLRAIVNYCTDDEDDDCPDLDNAYWDEGHLSFGAGFEQEDDTIGHELTHGVTEYTSGLYYAFQSGAINESMSDVFGEFIDDAIKADHDGDADAWLVGESRGAYRSLKDPTAFGDPDRIGSPRFLQGAGDDGGVHTNSGVGNKTAYLIAEGGTFNGQSITGLRKAKTAQIYYAVQTTLLTSASDYRDLGLALSQACRTLVGQHEITAADCAEVDKAVAATELADGDRLAPEAAACPAGTSATASVLRTDVEDAAAAAADWSSKRAVGTADFVRYPGAGQDPYASSGRFSFFGAAKAARTDFALTSTRDVVVPAGGVLTFDHAYSFEVKSDGLRPDGGVVEVSTDGGSTWAAVDTSAYTGTLAPGTTSIPGAQAFVGFSRGYLTTRLSLAGLVGQAVRLRFRVVTNASVGEGGWWIDDIDVHGCAAPVTDPPAQDPGGAAGGGGAGVATQTQTGTGGNATTPPARKPAVTVAKPKAGRKAVVFTVTPTEAGRLTIAGTAKGKRGRKTTRVSAGRAAKAATAGRPLRVSVTVPAALRRLQRRGSVAVTYVVTLKTAAGTTVTRKVQVRLPRRR